MKWILNRHGPKSSLLFYHDFESQPAKIIYQISTAYLLNAHTHQKSERAMPRKGIQIGRDPL